MAKYLWQVSYTPQGAQGPQKDGGSARRAVVQRLVEQAGGKLESFYFALGESDVYAIADLPDAKTAAAVDEIDASVKQAVNYRPPGSGAK